MAWGTSPDVQQQVSGLTFPGCKSSYALEGRQMESERMNISLHLCFALLQSLLLPGTTLRSHQNPSFRGEGWSYLLFQCLVGFSVPPLALVQQCCQGHPP